ncbi:MAG: ribonuclease Z [Gemmatimonadota bacterium]
MLRLTFLGTASSRPTVGRNVSALAVQREGAYFLFDCGEGTQRQMMRFGVGFGVEEIFITHLHADHYLGLTGLLRTLSLQGREEELVVWGPRESQSLLRQLVELGGERLAFPVALREIGPGDSVRYEGFRLEAFDTRHTRESFGLLLAEEARLGRFDVARARAMGVPEGPLYGRLHRGETVRLPDGTLVEPAQLVGPPRPGRRVVYSGDTAPCDSTVEAARGADLLVHEATFGEEERRRAAETGHSTARQAAEVASAAGVRELILTHLSARYAEQAGLLAEEARTVFPRSRVARDGYVTEVTLREEAVPGESRDRTGSAVADECSP